MEACSTHGPVDHGRYGELNELFGNSSAGLIFISCFPDRRTLRSFISDLAWETEAWVATEPTHMIHLNGSRFPALILKMNVLNTCDVAMPRISRTSPPEGYIRGT